MKGVVVLHDILKDLLPFIVSLTVVFLNNIQTNKKSDKDGLDDLNDRLTRRNQVLTKRVDQLTEENQELRERLNKK